FNFPRDGSVLSIGKVFASDTRVDLQDVSMLGGRVHADRVTIRHGHRAKITGLVVQGLLRDAGANALYQLDTGSYLVVSQKAVIGHKTGYVGLRLSVAAGYPGVAQGAQLLVGLRERGNESSAQLASSVVTAAGPWASLGFGAAPTIAGLPVVTEPLLGGVRHTRARREVHRRRAVHPRAAHGRLRADLEPQPVRAPLRRRCAPLLLGARLRRRLEAVPALPVRPSKPAFA